MSYILLGTDQDIKKFVKIENFVFTKIHLKLMVNLCQTKQDFNENLKDKKYDG